MDAQPFDITAEFLNQNRAFGAVVADADPQAPVPSCPGWTVDQLFRHVGRGNRWAAQIVADRRDSPLNPREVPDGKPPADPADALRWLDDGARLLVDAVATGPETEVWTFVGPRPASWWVRRRLHELVVHHADAVIAVGAEPAPDSALAADCLSEWLDLVTLMGPDRQETVHLHATDDGLGDTGEWMIRGKTWSHEHGKGDVAVRGPVTDLLLITTGRRAVGDTAATVFGSEALLADWLTGTKI